MSTATKLSLKQMQAAQLPRLDWRTLIEGDTDKLTEDDTRAMDEYFQQFIQLNVSEAQRCPCCQSSFGEGGLAGWLMAGAEGHATLEWGIAHGEAFCSRCRYPFRVYHRNVGPVKFLNLGLPYHPDELQAREEATA